MLLRLLGGRINSFHIILAFRARSLPGGPSSRNLGVNGIACPKVDRLNAFGDK